MDEAMDTEASHSEQRSLTLDPWEYGAWIRSIQKKMLTTDSDEARSTLAHDLVQAYRAMSEQTALPPRDWHLYLSVSITITPTKEWSLYAKQLATTFQRFSQFVSAYMPSEAYESTLSAANSYYADAQRLWQDRESYEDAIGTNHSTLDDAWQPYLAWQSHRLKQMRVAKNKAHLETEEEMGTMLYYRALHRFGWYPRARNQREADAYANVPPTLDVEKAWKQKQGRKSHKMQEREQASARVEARSLVAQAESLWLDLLSLLHGPRAEAASVLRVCEQATRTLPTSGRLWASYMRMLARFQRPATQVQQVYARLMASQTLGHVGGGAALLCVLQAHIDCERAFATHELAMEQHKSPDDVLVVADVDRFMRLYEGLVGAIATMYALPATEQDANLTLEKYASDWIERAARAIQRAAGAEAAAGLTSLADDLWAHALQKHAMNANAYLEAALYYKRHDDDKRARQTFKSGMAKQGLENKAVIVQAWVAFEHERGTPADIEHAEAKAKIENDRLWRAWYKYQATATPSHTEAAVPRSSAEHTQDAHMPDTDMPDAPKRKADDEGVPEKKHDEKKEAPPARDREFSSVMVSGLPVNATEGDIRTFFRDCGVIFEVIGPRTVREVNADEETSAVQVEFTDRDGANAARTRDWKRVGGQSVHVSLSYACTLYVTNFPPETTDDVIRERFGAYGAVFDVRWPSRKFVQSRRFCYVQYTNEAAAQAALAMHGQQWQDGYELQVLLSNPQHKKPRSDAHANDKELYMTGLPRSATVDDVRAFFAPYGPVADVRMPARPDGKSRGIAFIEFASTLDARRAMQATNSTKFHGRLVAVTLAEAGRTHRPASSAPTQADRWARTIHVQGLPPDAQEALIQQAMEAVVGPNSVRRVFWTPGRAPQRDGTCDSLVEMVDAETAGRAVLAARAMYGDAPLTLQPHTGAASTSTTSMPMPRSVGPASRGPRKEAFGFARVHTTELADTTPKDQDAFRQMLQKK
ncbi:hypothetical protein ACI68E_000336 [Malassezia pachydermatis]